MWPTCRVRVCLGFFRWAWYTHQEVRPTLSMCAVRTNLNVIVQRRIDAINLLT